MAADRVERITGRAMSCEVRIVVVGGDPEPASPTSARRALERIAALEAKWTRFRSDSEISRLNAAAGRPCVVSPETRELVVAMVQGWHVTSGAFDPTLLVPLVGLGYAASRSDVAQRTSLPAGALRRGRPEEILVDANHELVRLPAGTTLDPGGLGKGFAADLVVRELLHAGAEGALVEVGGDLRLDGTPPTGDAWPVGVDDSWGDGRECPADTRLALVSGGVATSSTLLRTWHRGSRALHHLLHPDTLRPADGGVVAATVIAGTAAWAEVLTKAAIILPRQEVLGLLGRLDAAVRLTLADGTRFHSASWHTFDAGSPALSRAVHLPGGVG